MAKTGFTYYQSETDRFQDIRIKRLKKEFSGNGYAVYSYILNEIYRVQGCFLEWDENTAFDVCEYWGLKETLVIEIVNYCCAVGLFNKELLTNERVLTSQSIQSRYINMCKLTKRKPIIPEKFNLLSEETYTNSEFSQETPSFQANNKVKESKGEENKEYPPSIPPQAGGGDEYLVSSLSQRDGIRRNYQGLLDSLKRLNIQGQEFEQIIKLSNYGEMEHQVWGLINQCLASVGKNANAKDKIKLPSRFIIAKLKGK